MSEPLALKDHTSESQIFFSRATIGFGLMMLLTLCLLARLFDLQIVEHSKYVTLSDKNRIQIEPIPPTRGLIYDRNGRLLADNVPSYTLTITVERVHNLKATLAKIKSLIGLSKQDIDEFMKRLKRRQRPFEAVPLLFKLTQKQIAKIGVNEYELPGVDVKATLIRHYPYGKLMAHAVGSVRRITESDARKLNAVAYSGIDDIGKRGVEEYYEKALLGKVGYERVETNARGKIVKVLSETKPIPGHNLVLTLDTSLQRAASEALGNRRGAVVAMNPQTGGILALVSEPSYNPNLFVTGIPYNTYKKLRDSPNKPLFNRAIQGLYEPGSTIKPFIGIAGLATGVITPQYTIYDPGWFKLPGSHRIFRDWSWRPGPGNGEGGQGEVDLDKAIYRSVNVYFYNLANMLGIDRIDKYLKMFGFGMDTALDLPEAQPGLLPTKAWKLKTKGQPWYPGDTVNVGIGQGNLLVTPLQMATAVSIIANRGKAVAPHMLMTGSDLLQESTVPRLKNINNVPGWIWKVITKAMVDVVHRGNKGYDENGTAWFYIGQNLPYLMAGKSGTAQIVGIPQGQEYDGAALPPRDRKNAWFIAFAPAEHPVIAVSVLVVNGGGGSEVAAPIARKVIDHYLLNEDHDINIAATTHP